jgi:hypothetical protein
MVDKVTPVVLAISEDSTHDIRTALRDAEDKVNRVVTDINKALVQLEALIVTRTARDI